jgi:DNA topoisomerase-1
LTLKFWDSRLGFKAMKANHQKLVIVESPTKAKTIRKFLPKGFVVEASVGHVRDLPQSAADIPAALKKEEWTKIGVNVEKDFEPLYIVPKGKTKVINELKRLLKEADELYLATDEDREGESISWHLTTLLKPKVPVKRMVFHEITSKAIQNALKNTRAIDEKLVRAQETRRILDRLVGYTLSPLIWKKIAFGLSAGRVQSSALRMIVDRERERIRFKKSFYWDIDAELLASRGEESFTAKLMSVAGARIASGKDFDETTGTVSAGKDVKVLDEAQAKALAAKLPGANWKVLGVEEKEFSSRPYAPFITSTLQQESNRKLGLSSRDTMRLAQQLYEEGLITYMRTDSPSLSTEAVQAARDWIGKQYGKEFLPAEPRTYTAKSKGAQEAHEAIRPAGSEFAHPDEAGLTGKAQQLYELIWKRTVASQMVDARKLSISARVEAGDAVFGATGTRILFAGFLRAYVEGSDDPEHALEDREKFLPELKAGQGLTLKDLKPLSHETSPPARFTEASIVRELEKAGIGRPSTYASIISTLLDRDYVRKNGNALVPTFTAMAVTQLLESHFTRLVDADFTSTMEKSLDEIAEGEREWLPYLREFYLGKDGLQGQVEKKDKQIDPKASRLIELPHLPGVEVRVGRFGAYIVDKKDESLHVSIPEDTPPADLTEAEVETLVKLAEKGPTPMGVDPKSAQPIYCLTGRFGPYVQLGEVSEANPKPRRASVPRGVDPKAITLDQALQYLSLPRELGLHPEKKKPILANAGRFGPYVSCDGDFRSLKKEDNVYTVTLDRALELLNQPKMGRSTATVLKELGAHPEDGKPVQVLEGKYGPYIKHKSKSASVPKEVEIEKVTMAMALELLAARAGAQKGTKGRRGGRSSRSK